MRLLKLLGVSVLFCAGTVRANAQRLPSGVGAPDVGHYARLLAMTDTRQLDTALVSRALSRSWTPLRAAATLAIGQVGVASGMSGAPRLRGLLTDSEPAVAANAAYALGLLRDSSSITDLSRALSANTAVAREAAWALGEIGAPARTVITAGLSTVKDDATTIQLLLAAAKLRPVPIPEIRPYLSVAHPSVVWAATYAIARTRAAAGVRDLIDLESSPS